MTNTAKIVNSKQVILYGLEISEILGERVGPVSYKVQLNNGQTCKRHLDHIHHRVDNQESPTRVVKGNTTIGLHTQYNSQSQAEVNHPLINYLLPHRTVTVQPHQLKYLVVIPLETIGHLVVFKVKGEEMSHIT